MCKFDILTICGRDSRVVSPPAALCFHPRSSLCNTGSSSRVLECFLASAGHYPGSRLSLDPRVCILTLEPRLPGARRLAPPFPNPSQILINPLYPDSDVIKGRASEPFMSVISHSLAVCLTSVPPVAPGSVSINHKQRSGQKGGDEEMELYILNGNRWDCVSACVCCVCACVD